MILSMNWTDLSFKASDVVKLIVGLVAVIVFAQSIKSDVKTVADNQTQMRETQVEFIKDYKINQKAMELKVNAIEIEQKLQGMRIDALEKANNK